MDHEPLYREPRHYDLHNARMVADIPFYLNWAQRVGGEVLEFACGTGRLTIPLAKAGIKITGVDFSAAMLAHARSKAEKEQVVVDWVEGDCRNFDLKRKFNLVLLPFNALQLFTELPSIGAVLDRAREHLHPNGTLILDVFNPHPGRLMRSMSPRLEVIYSDPEGRGVIVVTETTFYDEPSQILRIQWSYSLGGDRPLRTEPLDLRCYFPVELQGLLQQHGFEVSEKFGNFSGKPFETGDHKLILVCSHINQI